MTNHPDLRAILREHRAARGGAPLVSPDFPEQVGPFSLHAPIPGQPGWIIAMHQQGLPVVLADRDACLLIAGLMLAGGDVEQLLIRLRDTHNRGTPSCDVTVGHIVQATIGDQADDEDEEEQ